LPDRRAIFGLGNKSDAGADPRYVKAMPNDTSKPAGAVLEPAPRRKRSYAKAAVGEYNGGFALLLDGRLAKTPAKAAFVLPTLAAAEAVAKEWEAQGEEIDPASMPLTRIAYAAIDGVAAKKDAGAAEIVKYAETDLVCYRASGPQSLVRAEAEAWDPILKFAAERLDARFICAEGIRFTPQPAAAVAAVRAKVEDMARGPAAAFALASLSVMTALGGSVLIALALSGGAISVEEAWRAAHVEEDYESRLWGEDEEAKARRARRFTEISAAERLWRLIAA
jgi:chaperone required for assembly of F1-ATPase